MAAAAAAAAAKLRRVEGDVKEKGVDTRNVLLCMHICV